MAAGRNGSGGLVVIIQMGWGNHSDKAGFESYWMIQRFSCPFLRTIPFRLTSLYLNSIENKGKKINICTL